MNNSKKLFLTIGLLAVLFIVAALVYPPLSARYLQNTQEKAGTETEKVQEDKVLAPDLIVYDADGNEVKLSDFIGKPVVMNFWASWCPPCKAEMPDFQNVYESLESDTVFLMINMTDGARETIPKAQAYVSEQNFTFPVYFDTKSQAGSVYGISSIPTTIFVDREGYAILGYEGAVDKASLISGIERISD